MRILLVAVGRCREASIRDGVDDYARRLSHYASVKQVEVKAERARKGFPTGEILAREGRRLLQAIPDNAYTVALDREGESCGSEELSRKLARLGVGGKSRIAFVIGGAFGLGRSVIERADWRLSLSRMTFPHEMARLILVEQVYRALTIIRGEEYHK
ncbi:MAG: 23S rRNA (pseudouridine(1915)-N(3))-methyltransferase RlmH [Candidatus Latescibacteria bacterium]|jgi:23S rRNA (pseudouridine1915-N3)-methyltransferase|nr:23S rRNA (pseudouridine(1915)-N(3))-methyltransferase RlmH [Candidatus Latescibacterota bacterium]